MADAADATDSSPIVDAASEHDAGVGFPRGAFFCADPSSYFVEVNTAGGQDSRWVGPCNETLSGMPHFGVPRAALTINAGRISVSICAAQGGGANISFGALLANYNGGSGTAQGTWSDGSAPDATAINLDGTLDLERVGSIGDTVEGSYSLRSSSIAISGSFRVCHLFDHMLGAPPP